MYVRDVIVIGFIEFRDFSMQGLDSELVNNKMLIVKVHFVRGICYPIKL